MATKALNSDELRALVQLSTFRTFKGILGDWLLICGCFALAIYYPHPLVWIACFIVQARNQLALAVLMHDGAHRRMAKSIGLNDFIAQFFCAAPVFFSMYSYQRLHLKHHQDPLTDDDPDISLTGGFPIPRMSLARKLLRDLLGISYFKFIRYFLYMARSNKKKRPEANENTEVNVAENSQDAVKILMVQAKRGKKLGLPVILFSIVLVNSIMFTTLFLLGHGWLYLTLWILPQVTLLQFLLRIRGIAEHAGYQPNKDQRLNTRTVVNPIQTFFFAPHNVNLHIEHHLYPAIPYYNLKKAHKLFMKRNVIPEGHFYSGYRAILSEVTN